MATGNELAALRRCRSYYIAQFTRLAKKLDDIEQSGCPEEIDLLQIKERLETFEEELRALQHQIVTLDEGEIARGSELAEEYERLQLRVAKQLINTRRSTPSQSTSGESAVGRESASLKLPEEQTRGLEIREQYNDICDRLRRNQRIARQLRSSRPAHNGSATGIKLPRNALNQPTCHDPLDLKEVNSIQDNRDQPPPTETIAVTRMAIPSHFTRSSARDTHNMSTVRDLTTTFAASASQSSDSTLHNVLNQSITQDPLDQKELILTRDDNGRTHPTEDTASTPAPIPSHTTRSSPRDIHNISTTRDLTTTLTASASQPSGSTTQNVSNQPNAPDLQDQKELNHVPDKNSDTPPGNTTLHVTPDMDIISESLSPRPNVKNSPSPRRRGATPASNPNRDNLHVITTMTNHLIVSSFQNAPADFNTCPLSPQSTTWDKSLILSLADCWTTPVQLPAIREKARSGWVNGGSLVPQSTMTSSTLPQPKQQRGCPNDMQYFHESDVAEIPYKKGEPCSRSYHDTIHDMWDKIAQLGQIIGGSSVLQSNTQLCDVFEPIPCITGVSFNDTSWGKLFKDTSWAEVFHDTAWAELYHDTSWIVNFNGPLTQRRTRHQDRRVSSTQRPFGRIIEFTLATTVSSGQLRTSKKADEIASPYRYYLPLGNRRDV